MNRLASFFSYMMHPIFMPLLSVYLLFQLPSYINFRLSPAYFNAIYICVSFNLIVVPLSLSLYLKRSGQIQSLRMEHVEERVIPYGITAFFYLMTYFLFMQIKFPDLYLSIFLAATFAVFILFILALFKQKVSAHLTGIGGICGLLIVTNQALEINTILILMIFILLAGILGASRLKLNAHTASQVFWGFLIGLFTQLLVLL